MSVSLEEVINHGGYNLDEPEDALWLLSKQKEFEELVERAEEIRDAMREDGIDV